MNASGTAKSVLCHQRNLALTGGEVSQENFGDTTPASPGATSSAKSSSGALQQAWCEPMQHETTSFERQKLAQLRPSSAATHSATGYPLAQAEPMTKRLKLPAMTAQRQFMQKLRGLEQQEQNALRASFNAVNRRFLAFESHDDPLSMVNEQLKRITHRTSGPSRQQFLWDHKKFALLTAEQKNTEGDVDGASPQATQLCRSRDVSAWGYEVLDDILDELERIKSHCSLLKSTESRWTALRTNLLAALPELKPDELSSLPDVRVFSRALGRDIKHVDQDIVNMQRAILSWQGVLQVLRHDQVKQSKVNRLAEAIVEHFFYFGLPEEIKHVSKEELDIYAKNFAHTLLSSRFACAAPRKGTQVVLCQTYRHYWSQPLQRKMFAGDADMMTTMCRALAGCVLEKEVQVVNPLYRYQRLIFADALSVAVFYEWAKLYDARLRTFLNDDLFDVRKKIAVLLDGLKVSFVAPKSI